jgi:tetrahydromethanopterin S-methyltransferase subunit E
MSTDLPYIEGLIDALANTIWWTFDLKFGRLARPRVRRHPNFFTIVIDHVQRIWDSVAMRLVIATISPYIMQYIFDIRHPFRLVLNLVVLSLTWPWIYQIFIYTWFLDPLRRLPGPKVW